jgi:hypothetical protein
MDSDKLLDYHSEIQVYSNCYFVDFSVFIIRPKGIATWTFNGQRSHT